MTANKRPKALWLILAFFALSLATMLAGQTMALIDYDFAVQIGLQESVKKVSEFGVQVNRAFGAADTIVYMPLTALSLIGLFLRKAWSLVTAAATMGISAYWATVIAFTLVFLPGAPGYELAPGWEYWLFILAYIIFGVWGVFYLIFRGNSLIE